MYSLKQSLQHPSGLGASNENAIAEIGNKCTEFD